MLGNISSFFILPDSLLVISIVLSMFLVASYTDITENKVYNKMNILYIFIRIGIALGPNPIYPFTVNSLLGGIIGGGLLMLPALILNTNHMAGDIKFCFVLGLWMGGLPMLLGLLLGTAIFIVTVLIRKKGMLDIMPFAPFISTGCAVMMVLPYMNGWR